MWKNLNDDRDSGKIKVQKYLENEMKNKSSVRANLLWPSLKETFEKCHQTKNIRSYLQLLVSVVFLAARIS